MARIKKHYIRQIRTHTIGDEEVVIFRTQGDVLIGLDEAYLQQAEDEDYIVDPYDGTTKYHFLEDIQHLELREKIWNGLNTSTLVAFGDYGNGEGGKGLGNRL